MLKVVVISLYYTVKAANLIRAAGFTDSKKKRLPAEQTPAPEEPEKSEVQKIHAQDKPETVNEPKQTKSHARIVSETQDETRAVDEEVRADESPAETRRSRGLTSVCVSQRSKVLAQKRQSVLRSLQGLVTSTRGKTPSGAEEPQKRPERSRVKPTEDEQNGERRSAE